ncbi:MAG TPA: hypothetical protein P5076_23290, partial [Myxococcota bacterium]|nr:hypothetical protein [Myxococcota bacterium]
MKARILTLAWLAAGPLAALGGAGCEEAKPTLSGRLTTPADLQVFTGCPLGEPECDPLHHLLLMANSQSDELRVFDVEKRAFFLADNPLFPFAIPVGERPRSLALDPHGEWAFVVNSLSEDVSLVDLRPGRLVEVDTDMNTSTCAASLHPDSDRCRAGVSRVGLGEEAGGLPEMVVAQTPAAGQTWDRGAPLSVWVSLAGAGQVAELRFHYPEEVAGWPQRLEQVRTVDVGGMPSGLALSTGGGVLWVADEDADSVARVDTASGAVTRVLTGGPSRRLALTPDGSRLYVVRTDEPLIVLVDPAVGAVVPPGTNRETATDPDSSPEGIRLPGIPRDLTFVVGVPYLVSDESAQAREWTTEMLTAEELEAQGGEEHVVTTLAYLTDLNGNVYILDAENHRPIDRTPFVGASASIPGYTSSGVTLETEVVAECAARADCEHPVLADFNRTYDGVTELDPIYHGVWVQTGLTRSEDWVLRWQGNLPGTGQTQSGRFEGWRFRDERAVVDFQRLGALVDDLLVVTSQPREAADGSGGVHPSCSPGTGAEDTGQARAFFKVLVVEPGYLTLQAVEGMDPGLCWPEAVLYELRPATGWTVWSSLDGLVGRAALSPYQAIPPDPPSYDNGRIAFTIYEP